MISIRFKDYLIDKPSFERLFKQVPCTPSQAKPFEALAEVFMDLNRELTNMQAQLRVKEPGDEQLKFQKEIMSFPEQLATVKGYKAPKCSSLEKWLRLSVEDYVVLKKHKVIED